MLWFGSPLPSKPRIRANFRTATLASRRQQFVDIRTAQRRQKDQRADPPLRARSFSGDHRHDRRAGVAQQSRSCPPRRPARLRALLGSRAPQHAFDRQLGAGHHDRPDRQHDHPHARRLRRRDAAQSRAARRGRALQGARGPVPRPHRSRPRPRARHRPGHVICAASAAGRSQRRRLPRPLPGTAAVRAGRLPGRPSVPQRARHAGRRSAAADLSARARATTARSLPPMSAQASRSRIISRTSIR